MGGKGFRGEETDRGEEEMTRREKSVLLVLCHFFLSFKRSNPPKNAAGRTQVLKGGSENLKRKRWTSMNS